MAQSSTLVTLQQLTDLALNCPELGSINFSILHTLLHVILLQVNQQDVALEFHGSDSEKLQNMIMATRPSNLPLFSDYTIMSTSVVKQAEPVKRKKSKDSNGKKNVSLQDIKDADTTEARKEKEIKVIERRKDSKEEPSLTPTPLLSPPASAMKMLEDTSKGPQFSVVISKHHFEELERDVVRLKEEIKELKEMPGNMGLIEASRSGEGGPILDMFQILNLTKRMDAVEEGMQKMASIVEDVAKEGSELGSQKSKLSDILDQTKELKESIPADKNKAKASLEIRVARLEHQLKNMKMTSKPKKKPDETIPEEKEQEMKKSASQDQATDTEGGTEVQEKSSVKSITVPTHLEGVELNELSTEEAMRLIQEELATLRDVLQNDEQYHEIRQELNKLKEGGVGVLTTEGGGAVEITVNALESKFSDCFKQLNNLDSIYNSQMQSLQEQVMGMQKEMEGVLEKLNTVLPAGDSAEVEGENTMELYNKIVTLEKELNGVMETANKLSDEKEVRDKNIETIFEQIDLLKIIKANREDLEDALGDKADACMINRKVSHDQFDAACEDLTRGIEDALGKLQHQETMWQMALEGLQREVGNKLDKMEVDPLRDFVNSKLKALQEKFKALTQLKRDQEAAGTKSRFLRNVNCISCDKDVVMRKEMDVSLRPQPFALPPSRNIAPYLAYELDQLRKQQKCVPNSKNLNFFESALKSKTAKDKDHICNRYCGGSHTTTTPQQRVTRLGHFLEQWGPEIAPLHDEYIRGKDNHMYKSRDDEQLKKMMMEDMASKHGKGSRSGAAGDGSFSKAKKEDIVTKDTEDGEGEQRDTMVDQEAQDIITEQAGKPRPTASGEIETLNQRSSSAELEVLMPHDQPRPSAVQDQRKSTSSKRASADQVQEVRASVATSERKPSEAEKKPSISSEKKGSVAPDRRSTASHEEKKASFGAQESKSSVEGQEKKASVAQERRPSGEAQEKKGSVMQERRISGEEKRPSVEGQEKKASVMQERRPTTESQEKKASMMQERRPTTESQEKKPSVAPDRRPTVESQEKKASVAQERRASNESQDKKPIIDSKRLSADERKQSSASGDKRKSDGSGPPEPDARRLSQGSETKKSIGFQEQ